MDVWKKSVTLGLALLARCVLVETMDLCTFAKMFPPKKKNELTKDDTSQEDKGTDCPSGYTRQFKNSCYKFVGSSSGNRSDARSTCKDDSSRLVFIETKEENDFLVREAENITTFWVAIHERPNLFWDNGNQVTFANIDPDNEFTFVDGRGCYSMSDHGERYWLGRTCSLQHGYICEYEGADCPSVYKKKLNESCYKFVDFGATLSEARSACKNDSAHLVFIETKEENDFLVGEAGRNIQYWIGIHERPNLFWDNGNHVTFVNIDPDNKDTFKKGTGCYSLSKNDGRYWFDRSCSSYHRYICEYEGVGCPSEYNKQFYESCYKFAESAANLSVARSECMRNSSHLVFIETKEENDFLVGDSGRIMQYWIGIHERPNLFWDNGNQVTFANMNPDDLGTFDDATGCYIISYTDERYWRDSSCTGKYGFICEHEGTVCPAEYFKSKFSCYKFVGSVPGATRSEARSACEADSSHLVLIETKEENDFLIGQTKNDTEYWIGIHERPNLFWDNGNQVTFANIDPDDPLTFNDGTGCYAMSNNDGRWIDKNCSAQFGYICEYEDTVSQK